MYTPVKLNISIDQHEKLKNAINTQKTVSIKVDSRGGGGGGKDVFLLTHSQIQRLERAKLIGKSTLNIHLSKKQVKANIQHRGGALLGGLATGLVSGAVEKAVGGRGLYLHPSGRRSDGDGLYLHKSGHCESGADKRETLNDDHRSTMEKDYCWDVTALSRIFRY